MRKIVKVGMELEIEIEMALPNKEVSYGVLRNEIKNGWKKEANPHPW